MHKNIKRGQVWYYVPTVAPSGHIQKGPRPVVIVSNDRINETSSVVLAVPCTTQIKRNFPTHTLFILNRTVSIALTEQLMPINVDELTDLRATLDGYIMDQIDDAIKITLGYKPVPMTNSVNNSAEAEIENVNNSVESANNSSLHTSQINKFYSRYPDLAPARACQHCHKWTPEAIKQLLKDFTSVNDKKVLEKKYGLSYDTLRRYYYKYRDGGK